MNEKTINWISIGLQVGFIVASFTLPEVFAVAPSQEDANKGVYKIKKDLVDMLVSNASYIGASCAVLGGAVLAFGSEIKKVIGNNMGYVGYLAFAPAVVGLGVAAMGATI